MRSASVEGVDAREDNSSVDRIHYKATLILTIDVHQRPLIHDFFFDVTA